MYNDIVSTVSKTTAVLLTVTVWFTIIEVVLKL
jgi:hypothetical protein